MENEEIHIFPFYCNYEGVIKIEYCDLKGEYSVIRGVRCKKMVLEGVPVYIDGKQIDNTIYYWNPINKEGGIKMGLRLLNYKPKGDLREFLKKKY